MENEVITEIPREELPKDKKRWYEIMCRLRKVELFFQEMNTEDAEELPYCQENQQDFYIMIKDIVEEFVKYTKKCQKKN